LPILNRIDSSTTVLAENSLNPGKTLAEYEILGVMDTVFTHVELAETTYSDDIVGEHM
jgi:hypothetical protein